MADNKIKKHKYVYGGYEVGSGGPIWCEECGADVNDPVHIRDKDGKVAE